MAYGGKAKKPNGNYLNTPYDYAKLPAGGTFTFYIEPNKSGKIAMKVMITPDVKNDKYPTVKIRFSNDQGKAKATILEFLDFKSKTATSCTTRDGILNFTLDRLGTKDEPWLEIKNAR